MTGQQTISIAGLMAESGVGFGTSGVRGLEEAMTDRVCYLYTTAFLQYLGQQGGMPVDRRIALAGDLRPSTGRIMAAVARAIVDGGYLPVNCGLLPSPAVAYYGLQQRIPAVMITGSHIPADRNGIKFNTAQGEILKEDEAGIRAQQVDAPDLFNSKGQLREPFELGPVDYSARTAYLQRWLHSFPAGFLSGKRIGFYEHSAVGRDLLREIYGRLGADVTGLARSERFIPVDTEAIRDEDVRLAREWAATCGFDAVLSTDGDSDRPLIADETGAWLRGDIAGILCARFCQADVVVTPVTCNTAVELSGWFRQVRRTRVGSPYVIAEMQRSVGEGAQRVTGYEANGGFLTASPVQIDSRVLDPLPTRDPVIVHLAILGLSQREGKSLSQLVRELPPRVTASGRVADCPVANSHRLLDELAADEAVIAAIFPDLPPVAKIDTTDGVRMICENDEIVHLRASGNAPELRCYTEAGTEERAHVLLNESLVIVTQRCR